MKVSVAMATYNGGRHLREQLASIRSQTLLPMELVISDDGSVDDTLAIARRFAADAPFQVVVVAPEERLGFTQNFVRAIRHCTGDIVALCDQDDVWTPDKLAIATAPFADEAVTTVTHRVQVVDENLKPTSLVMPEGSYRGKYTLWTIDPWFSPNGMQMLFRRAPVAFLLAEAPPLSAYGFGTAPFDEWIFYLGTLTGTAVLLDGFLGVWRRHTTAITRDVQTITADASTANHVHLALHSGSEAYTFRAEVTASRAEFVARATLALNEIGTIPGRRTSTGTCRRCSAAGCVCTIRTLHVSVGCGPLEPWGCVVIIATATAEAWVQKRSSKTLSPLCLDPGARLRLPEALAGIRVAMTCNLLFNPCSKREPYRRIAPLVPGFPAAVWVIGLPGVTRC